MSYTITITADTVAELAGRLLAMGTQLASPASAASPTVTLVEPANGKAYNERATEEVLYVSPIAVEAAQSDEPEIVFEPKVEVESAPADKPEPKLDYVKDVAPLVLRVVDVKGRAAAEKLLADFDVSRASELSKDEYPLFVKKARKLLGE